jgi:hypothetical protein
MLFNKSGKFAPLDQLANLGKTPGRMSLAAMMITAFMFVVMMVMVMLVLVLMLVLVRLMPMIMFVTGFAVIRGRAIRFMRMMIVVLRGIMRRPGVNVEFHPRDPSASLALEMKVAIAQVQF